MYVGTNAQQMYNDYDFVLYSFEWCNSLVLENLDETENQIWGLARSFNL